MPLLELGRYEDARAAARRAAQIADGLAYERLACVLALPLVAEAAACTGRFDEALEAARRAGEIAPRVAQDRAPESEALILAIRGARGEVDLDAVLQGVPDEPLIRASTLTWLGVWLGRHDPARQGADILEGLETRTRQVRARYSMATGRSLPPEEPLTPHPPSSSPPPIDQVLAAVLATPS